MPSGQAIVQGVFLHVIGPGGGGHAPVGVQEDPEATDDQHRQEDEEEEDEEEGRLLLQGEGGVGPEGAGQGGQGAAQAGGHED